MYAAVHGDRHGRVYVSEGHSAAGIGGPEARPLAETIALPEGARLVPLPREASAFGRNGRIRGQGAGRLALGAVLPAGHVRLLAPSYRDDRAAVDLEPLPYCAVGARPDGELVVAARAVGPPARQAPAPAGWTAALRERPSNALVRQLARCARENGCVAAQTGLGRGLLPVPLGAAPAEAPRLPLAIRSAYPGTPHERAALRPTAAEIAELGADHLGRGGSGVAFGRACDGEPLGAIRVLEAAVARLRAPGVEVLVETSGSDPAALRRAIDAGVTAVTVRIASARRETYELLHGPVAHGWSEVRASLRLAAEHRLLTLALLVLPGLSDTPAEMEALLALIAELPGGRLELRDLGADHVRTLAALPHAPAAGLGTLLDRLGEADHFRLRPAEEPAAV